MSEASKLYRVLLVDDNPSIHEAVGHYLRAGAVDELAQDEAELFATPVPGMAEECRVEFVVDSAFSGQDGLALLEEAMRKEQPYTLAFVDVRMPAGWDGIETIEHLWRVDPHLEVVVCTAFSDYSWQEMGARLRHRDRYLVLKKPFDGIEIRQMAMSLAAKVELRLATERQIHQLEEAARAAMRASEAKSEFLANMSHEIRTPLNGVVGMLELLSDTPLQAEESRFVRGAQASVNCLLSLVNDILDFSKIEAGKVELDPAEFNLHQLVEDVAEILAHRAEQKGIEICCDLALDLPVLAVGDEDRIRQVLLNLAGNAVKFTEKGQVTIRARASSQTESEAAIEFEVEDTGIGIAENRRDRLFQVFSQVDSSTTRRYGGSGLGLALCERLVELMGGTIGCESALGEGSMFRFTVPVQKVGAAAEMSPLPASFAKLRVLVVDDNETNLEIVRKLMERWGIACATASYAPDALTELRSACLTGRDYNLIITDMQMPDMDGLTFVKGVRSMAEFQKLPVIMLSSMGQVVLKDRLEEAGLTACLTKPVRQSRLFEAIIEGVCAGQEDRGAMRWAVARRSFEELPAGVQVLVAEDNEMNQQVIRAYLKKLGVASTVVTSGILAVEQARTRAFDLVLMDWQMPEMNGVEAARQIRICEQFAGGLARNGNRLPVIAVTAHATSSDRDKCFEAGMDGYLVKPLNPRALAQSLKQHLSGAQEPCRAMACP